LWDHEALGDRDLVATETIRVRVAAAGDADAATQVYVGTHDGVEDNERVREIVAELVGVGVRERLAPFDHDAEGEIDPEDDDVTDNDDD
jgi:hypothetical protein